MNLKEYFYRVCRYIVKGIPNVHVSPQITYIAASERLNGKKIIITGGSGGIGASMAKKFSEEGAKVLIVGRKEEALKSISDTVGCQYIVFDVNNLDQIPEFFDIVESKFGKFDTLVNNAGISLHERSFFDVSIISFDKQMTTNLEAPFFMAQEFIKRLKKTNERGNVVFISSEAGDTVDYRPYGYTKAAINSVVKGLAYLFRKDNIRINAISPGVTASKMTGIDINSNLYAGEYGTGRFYLPEEIAEVAVFIISDASNCISGQIITCNNANTVNARWR